MPALTKKEKRLIAEVKRTRVIPKDWDEIMKRELDAEYRRRAVESPNGRQDIRSQGFG